MLVLFVIGTFRLVFGMYDGQTSPGPEWSIPVAEAKAAQTAAKETVGLPIRLKIPRIKVNAVIRAVGLASDGSMGIPKLPRDTAWYMLGPKPGETGSAVIAGHVNWLYGAIGVFERLKTLQPGDMITVQDDKGASIPFVVRKIHAYGLKDDASDVFLSNDGKSHLNLVTCSGIWDKAARIYSKRLVVFADKVAE